MKKRLIIVLLVSIIFLLSGCKKIENPIVTMEIENYGTIKIELYPEYAPNTVANFVNLVKDGFYDGNNFSIISGFESIDYSTAGLYIKSYSPTKYVSYNTGARAVPVPISSAAPETVRFSSVWF